ncbi:MAG: DUF4173 domain-containing protein [Chloroflexi bacterium]|nr:DUF4173 domain-containing protein [Chloroflexota bacterium]
MTPKKSTTIKSKSKATKKPIQEESSVSPLVIKQEAVSPPEGKAVMEKIRITPLRLGLVAIALGILFDYLFWDQLSGINYAIFLMLCLIGGLYVLISDGYKPALTSLVLIILFVFFITVAFLRQEPLTIFLAYAFSLFSIGLFSVTYLGGRWYFYGLSNYFNKFFQFFGDMFARPLGFIRQVKREQLERGVDIKKSPVWGVLRGLIIALPIVFCLGSILASADLVFNQKLDKFFEEFTAEKINENIQRFILILGFSYLFAGTILHSAMRSDDGKATGMVNPLIKPFVGFTESTVILASVSILFAAFVLVQFQYLFGGEINIGVAGYTYSQYARRGFNELVTVAFISLALILSLSGLTRRESELQKRIYTGLNILLVALVLIILASAYQRISMAIDWHGFSRLRLYPRILLIWLVLLFIAVAILEMARLEKHFAFAIVLASFGFAVSLALFNLDAAIVKHNIFRAWHGKNLNVPHLSSLSTDAIPALVEEFLSPSLPEETREGVGAILACYKYFEDSPSTFPYDWRSFNLSRWQAHQVLAKIRPYLAGYVIRLNGWPIRIKAPDGSLYDCQYRASSYEE